MSISHTSEQLLLFLYALILGIFIGMYYDLFRIMRHLGINSKTATIVQDIFFMVSLAPLTYIFCIGFNDGKVRAFILAGELIGSMAYRFTLGRLTVPLIILLAKPVMKLFKIVSIPFVKIDKLITSKISINRKIIKNKPENKKKENSSPNF